MVVFLCPEAGRKRTGTIDARDHWAADKELRKSELRPYFIHDYQALKKVLRQKQKKRQRIIAIVGAAAVVSSLVFSALIVRYAGRERPLSIEDFKETRLVVGKQAGIIARTEEQEEFAFEMYRMWENFCPHTVVGLEVTKLLMTVYVTRNIRNLPENDLEVLASNTVLALHRRFGSSACTLLVVQGDRTILEAGYNSITRSTRVKSYR